MIPVLLFIILLVIVFWVFIKKSHVDVDQPIPKRRGSTTPPKKPMPYHSVSVRPCAVPCEQFKQIKGQRFLTGDVPSLPLDGSNKKFFVLTCIMMTIVMEMIEYLTQPLLKVHQLLCKRIT